MSTTDAIAMRPLLFPDDTQFWYETPRWLGHTAYGGADFGDELKAVGTFVIRDGLIRSVRKRP
jgi:hypothetical protein